VKFLVNQIFKAALCLIQKLFASSKDKSDIPELLKSKGGVKKQRNDDDDEDQTDEEEISEDEEADVAVPSSSKPKPGASNAELGKRKAAEAVEIPTKKERIDEVMLFLLYLY